MNRVRIFIVIALCCLCYTIKCKDYSSCGQREPIPLAKILGGKDSTKGMWPWQVSVFKYDSTPGRRHEFKCGGAIIGAKWVVSAAHCFPDYPRHKYKIFAGDHKMYFQDEEEQERLAIRIHFHPEYNPSTWENDIAMVELDKDVKMGPHVRPVCLPRADERLSVPNENISVAGWGVGSALPPVLRHTFFKIQSNDLCRSTTSKHFDERVMFCAGDGQGTKDACKGDSGGSTVRKVRRNGVYRWVTVGLVSWGYRCGTKDKYGYYTRMEPFVNWINNVITGEYSTSAPATDTSPSEAIFSTSAPATDTSPSEAIFSTSAPATDTSPPKAIFGGMTLTIHFILVTYLQN